MSDHDPHGAPAPHDAPAHAGHGHPPKAGLLGSPALILLVWSAAAAAGTWAMRDYPDALAFAILLLPLLGFTVLALFGDAIRDQGEGAGAAVLACCTVATSFLLAVASVYHVRQFPAGHTGLRFTQPALKELGGAPGAILPWIEAGAFRVQFNLL